MTPAKSEARANLRRLHDKRRLGRDLAGPARMLLTSCDSEAPSIVGDAPAAEKRPQRSPRMSRITSA
jgi:hypothetical protein